MMIALTGGTGFVGQALLERALADEYQLTALARKRQVARKGLKWILGDLTDRKALAKLLDRSSVVIHVAGAVNAPDEQGFHDGNVIGTLNLIEAALEAGVPRFIYVSSLSAREPDKSAYGASKLMAERLVKASPLNWTIVRPPAVYGPRDREMFELFRAAKWGFVPIPKEGRASIVHVEDLARLLLALMPGGEETTCRTFEPDDGKPGGWTHDELALAIGQAVGKRPRTVGLSPQMMERAARLDGMMRGTRAKLTLDRASYFSHPDWVVAQDACPPAHIWRPRIETRQGLKSTADWYRAQGWL